jgi:hypothetical protein
VTRQPKGPPPFPIVEAYGYAADAATPDALQVRETRWCRFAGTPCEKFRQYRFGYCSVSYAAADDGGVPRVYAVCDHRLDGEPLATVVRDHFGATEVEVVPEIVLTDPRTSFDYVAFEKSHPENAIAIETQAIDIRGGGVGPAWQAWEEGKTANWRSYFSRQAEQKGRRDTVAYGVNMANIYKRLGLQVAVKGSYLKGIQVPFYVLMQDRPFQYLRRRINFTEVDTGWDITFITFDYDGTRLPDGSLNFVLHQVIRTTVADYVSALSSDPGMAQKARADFLDRVQRKARLNK